MFSGTFSLLPGGGGTAGSVSLLPSTSSGSTGTISLVPSYSYTAPQSGYSYTTAPYYSYSQTPATSYQPGAGIQAGPFGERGPYTPLDFPLMHELTPGEQLGNLNPRSGFAGGSILPYLALGVIAALLIK